MPIPGLDAWGISPVLKLRLKFYCPWTWVFIVIYFPVLFVILFWALYFYVYSYFPFFFLYSQLHHQYLLIPILTSSTLLFLYYNPLFSFPTTLSVPSHPLSSPAFTYTSHPPQTCYQTTPSSYTFTTCWPTYCTKFTQPKLLAIPDTSILHYKRNTPKHT
jgi:hypothetical protein